MNLFGYLENTARRWPDRTSIYYGVDHWASYVELRSRALALAGWMAKRCAPGDRIVIATKNCPEYLEILFACWAAGLVPVPVNAKLHAAEIAPVCEDVTPSLIFADPARAGELVHGCEGEVIAIGGGAYRQAVSGDPLVPLDLDPDHLAWIFFTSGTTGRAKGAMLTHRNLAAMSIAHLADFEPLEVGDAIIHAAPMSHGSGLLALPYILRGCGHVIPASGSYSPDEFLALSEGVERCGAFLAPTMLRRLRVHVENRETRSRIRSIIYGGGPTYVDEMRRCLDIFGPIFCHLYGQGESPMTIAGLRRLEHVEAPDAVLEGVGWPRTGVEVAIVDENGARMAPDEIGEIICRGDTVMKGYWGMSDATAATLQEGWLRTGDLGKLRSDGSLVLQGRSKELIVSGGSNIYPIEVENILNAHTGVGDVCVLGKADPEWGEIVVAFVVAEAGHHVDAATLDAHCRANMAGFKKPKEYHFVVSLPKNANGKIAKTDLAGWLA